MSKTIKEEPTYRKLTTLAKMSDLIYRLEKITEVHAVTPNKKMDLNMNITSLFADIVFCIQTGLLCLNKNRIIDSSWMSELSQLEQKYPEEKERIKDLSLYIFTITQYFLPEYFLIGIMRFLKNLGNHIDNTIYENLLIGVRNVLRIIPYNRSSKERLYLSKDFPHYLLYQAYFFENPSVPREEHTYLLDELLKSALSTEKSLEKIENMVLLHLSIEDCKVSKETFRRLLDCRTGAKDNALAVIFMINRCKKMPFGPDEYLESVFSTLPSEDTYQNLIDLFETLFYMSATTNWLPLYVKKLNTTPCTTCFADDVLKYIKESHYSPIFSAEFEEYQNCLRLSDIDHSVSNPSRGNSKDDSLNIDVSNLTLDLSTRKIILNSISSLSCRKDYVEASMTESQLDSKLDYIIEKLDGSFDIEESDSVLENSAIKTSKIYDEYSVLLTELMNFIDEARDILPDDLKSSLEKKVDILLSKIPYVKDSHLSNHMLNCQNYSWFLKYFFRESIPKEEIEYLFKMFMASLPKFSFSPLAYLSRFAIEDVVIDKEIMSIIFRPLKSREKVIVYPVFEEIRKLSIPFAPSLDEYIEEDILEFSRCEEHDMRWHSYLEKLLILQNPTWIERYIRTLLSLPNGIRHLKAVTSLLRPTQYETFLSFYNSIYSQEKPLELKPLE